jgi:hypothetical protein
MVGTLRFAHPTIPIQIPKSLAVIARTKTPKRAPASPRHEMPEFCIIIDPQGREGAGNAGCSPHPWPACNKKSRRQSPQVRRNIRHSLHDGVAAYSALSPVSGLDSHRHWRIARQLDASVGASGPHSLGRTRPALRRCAQPRPSHPAPRFVTIAKRPSL